MPSERRRPEPWPIALAALLAAMMTGSLTFLAVASANPDPLVVEDAYAAGQSYNAGLRALQRAEARGLSLSLETRPDAEGARVSVSLVGPEGAPVPAERVSVRRERPAEGGLDADFALEPAAEGYAGHVPLPRSGRWRLVATAQVGDATLRRSATVWR